MAVAPSGKPTVQLEADDRRNQHRKRLAQHGRLGFDAADAPAEYSQAVDHGGVGIGADQRIGKGRRACRLARRENHARQVFQIHLMADAGVWGHHLEILEAFLAPAEESVALDVALKFEFGVEGERIRSAEFVHLHRMIDHQFGGQQRIDALRIAAQGADGFAHGRQIHDRRHAGEVLQQHPRGHEGDFFVGLGLGIPLREGANVGGVDEARVFIAQQVFEQHFHREGKPGRISCAAAFESVEAVDTEFIAAYIQSIEEENEFFAAEVMKVTGSCSQIP